MIIIPQCLIRYKMEGGLQQQQQREQLCSNNSEICLMLYYIAIAQIIVL